MIVVSNRIQVAKGHEQEFEKRFEGRARLVETMPGFVRLEIHRPIKSDYYCVVTHWQDEASFRAWTDSAEFKEAHNSRPRRSKDLHRCIVKFPHGSFEVIEPRAVVPEVFALGLLREG